jgi:hypothetical protein
MQARNIPAAERRAQIAALKAQYAPKNTKPKSKVVDLQEEKLRRLTAKVLDELKFPNAIPSNVILAALKKAREL